MRAALATLRLAGFRRLALAYLVNELGDWLGVIALAVLVFDQTGSPLAVSVLFLAAQFLPALLVPALVARLEGLRTRVSLPALYAGEALAFALLAVLSDPFLFWAVVAIAAIDGAMAGSARSLIRAASGTILSAEGCLREGNALLNFGFTAAAAAGPALGGVLVSGAGVRVALIADAVSFVIVAALLAAAAGLPDPRPEAAGWWPRLRNGLRYVRERPVLRTLLSAQAAAFVFFTMVIPIEVVFAKETLGAGDFGYGALLASWGAGMVAGSFFFAGLRQHSLRLLLIASTAAIGAGYLATAASPTLLAACLASALGGAGNGVQWVALISAVQELARPAFHARVISLLESAASAMPGLGFVLGGAVAALLSARATFALAGAGVFGVLAVTVLVARQMAWPRPGEEQPTAGPDPPPLIASRRPSDSRASP